MCSYCDGLATASGNVNASIAPGASMVCLPPVIDNYKTCQLSPYAKLPDRLIKTLGDTFTAIEAGTKDSEGVAPTDSGVLALQNTAKGSRVDTWDALEHIPSSIINLYRLIYDRVDALLPAVWDEIMWIRWSWISTSMGFNVTYKNPVKAKNVLSGGASSSNPGDRAICFESRTLSAYFHKDCDCWRELPATPSAAKRDPEGLHLLVGDRPANGKADQIHIDPIDPYKFRDTDGTCNVTLDSDTLAHLRQVFNPGQPIRSPFDVMPNLVRQTQGDVHAGWAHDVDAEKTEVDDIAKSWASEERFQAVLGKSGWDYFQKKVDRLNAIGEKLNGMRVSPAPMPTALPPAYSPPPPLPTPR